jgi:hypothetical protein
VSTGDASVEPREDLSPTKERILEIAERLFAPKGFEGARTRDIAAQAGMNISTLHFHWKSKTETPCPTKHRSPVSVVERSQIPHMKLMAA